MRLFTHVCSLNPYDHVYKWESSFPSLSSQTFSHCSFWSSAAAVLLCSWFYLSGFSLPVFRYPTGAGAGLRGAAGGGPRSQQRGRCHAALLQPWRHKVFHEGQQGTLRTERFSQWEDTQQDRWALMWVFVCVRGTPFLLLSTHLMYRQSTQDCKNKSSFALIGFENARVHCLQPVQWSESISVRCRSSCGLAGLFFSDSICSSLFRLVRLGPSMQCSHIKTSATCSFLLMPCTFGHFKKDIITFLNHQLLY